MITRGISLGPLLTDFKQSGSVGFALDSLPAWPTRETDPHKRGKNNCQVNIFLLIICVSGVEPSHEGFCMLFFVNAGMR